MRSIDFEAIDRFLRLPEESNILKFLHDPNQKLVCAAKIGCQHPLVVRL
jgi:hypothetical protein